MIEFNDLGMHLTDSIGLDIKNNSVHITGDIDEKTLRDITLFFNYNDSDKIIFLSSYGGDLYCAFGIVDIIERHKAKTDTVIVGPCFSAASLIAMHATGTRYMSENSYILIHDIFNEGMKDMTVTDMQKRSKIFSEIQDRYINMVLTKSSFSDKELRKQIKDGDNFYSLEECLKLRLVDKKY